MQLDPIPLWDDPQRLLRRLRERLQGPLPGAAAQALLSPRPRQGWAPDRVPSGLRHAAALLLVYEHDGAPHVLLTERHADLSAHAGQISMPGGSVDPGESVSDAALREAEEEVGLDSSRVAVLGELTPLHIPASGFLLHAVVGSTTLLGPLVVAEAEVERVIEVPLQALADSRRIRVESWTLHGRPALVPYFPVDGLPVWGATAMVLAELLALLGHPPRVPEGPEPGPAGGTLPTP